MYLCNGDERSPSVTAVAEILIEALPNEREVIMTFAEQLKQEGRQEGR